METTARIYVAGHRGLGGSAIVRALEGAGYENLVLRSHSELDLRRQADVEAFFAAEQPDYVFLAAARVGGIHANATYRAEFIYDNLMIQSNVIESAYRSGVRRLLFLGSSCVYPRECPQPMREEYLLTGPLESTNEPYAVAKIAGIRMCQAYNAQHGTSFVPVMPTNLYGENDNFHLDDAHVLPALLRKIDEAKRRGAASVSVWGTGAPRREFLHVDDLAQACLFVMEREDLTELVNIGSGEEITVSELARTICEVVGYDGKLAFDSGRPDGTPRKLLDSGRLRGFGWRPTIGLRRGIEMTYAWYLRECVSGAAAAQA